VHERVFADSQHDLPQGHVYTLHAELEGMKLLPVMDKLLAMWNETRMQIQPMEATYRSLDLDRLASHDVIWGELPGRSGQLALQGERLGRDREPDSNLFD
jgi:hypothetical protein